MPDPLLDPCSAAHDSAIRVNQTLSIFFFCCIRFSNLPRHLFALLLTVELATEMADVVLIKNMPLLLQGMRCCSVFR